LRQRRFDAGGLQTLHVGQQARDLVQPLLQIGSARFGFRQPQEKLQSGGGSPISLVGRLQEEDSLRALRTAVVQTLRLAGQGFGFLLQEFRQRRCRRREALGVALQQVAIQSLVERDARSRRDGGNVRRNHLPLDLLAVEHDRAAAA
jgi:hypothetical protein